MQAALIEFVPHLWTSAFEAWLLCQLGQYGVVSVQIEIEPGRRFPRQSIRSFAVHVDTRDGRKRVSPERVLATLRSLGEHPVPRAVWTGLNTKETPKEFFARQERQERLWDVEDVPSSETVLRKLFASLLGGDTEPSEHMRIAAMEFVDALAAARKSRC